LLAIQISNRLKTSFAMAVPSSLTFQHPTIEAIADYLLANSSDDSREPTAAHSPLSAENSKAQLGQGQELDAHQAQVILADLDRLSNSDVEALLGAIELNPSSA